MPDGASRKPIIPATLPEIGATRSFAAGDFPRDALRKRWRGTGKRDFLDARRLDGYRRSLLGHELRAA